MNWQHVGCNSEAYCTECYPAETSATSIAPISSAKFHAAQFTSFIAPYGPSRSLRHVAHSGLCRERYGSLCSPHPNGMDSTLS